LPQLLLATGMFDGVFIHFLEPLHGKSYADAWFGAMHTAYVNNDVFTLEELISLVDDRNRNGPPIGNRSIILNPFGLTDWKAYLSPLFKAGTAEELGFMAQHAQIYGATAPGFDIATLSSGTQGLYRRYGHAPAGLACMTTDPGSTGAADTSKYSYFNPWKRLALMTASPPSFPRRKSKTHGPSAKTINDNGYNGAAHLHRLTGKHSMRFPLLDRRASEYQYHPVGFTGEGDHRCSTARQTCRDAVRGYRWPCPYHSAGSADVSLADHLPAITWMDSGDPVWPSLPVGNPLRDRVAAMQVKQGETDAWLIGEVLQHACGKDLWAGMRALATAAHAAWPSVDAAAVFEPLPPALGNPAKPWHTQGKAKGIYCDNPENRRRCRVGKPWGHPGSAATEASTEGAPEASTGSSSGEDGSSEGEGSAGPAFYDPASPDCPVYTGLPLPSGWGYAYDNRRNLFYFYDHADAGTVTYAHPTGGDAG